MRRGGVSTLPVYRGREQQGKEREAGDKGTGSGREGYGRREVLTPLSPSTIGDSKCLLAVRWGKINAESKNVLLRMLPSILEVNQKLYKLTESLQGKVC